MLCSKVVKINKADAIGVEDLDPPIVLAQENGVEFSLYMMFWLANRDSSLHEGGQVDRNRRGISCMSYVCGRTYAGSKSCII